MEAWQFKEENGDVGGMPSAAERERLVLLIEEAAEVQQIASKILRHGYESFNPFDTTKTPNRRLLERELGDFFAVLSLMLRTNNGDVSDSNIVRHTEEKLLRVKKYLHYQK